MSPLDTSPYINQYSEPILVPRSEWILYKPYGRLGSNISSGRDWIFLEKTSVQKKKNCQFTESWKVSFLCLLVFSLLQFPTTASSVSTFFGIPTSATSSSSFLNVSCTVLLCILSFSQSNCKPNFTVVAFSQPAREQHPMTWSSRRLPSTSKGQ